MSKLNIGIIGAGKRARALLKFINQMDDLTVLAAADVSEESLAATRSACKDDFRAFSDYNELLAMPDIDAVLICTPNALHADMAIAALQAGKPVYLEKPMATTRTDCDRIIQAAEQTGVPIMVGLQLRYSGVFQKVKEVIDSGEIGQVRMIWCKEFRGPFHPGWNNWRLSAELSGGSLVEKNVHHFDLFNWFAQSEPEKVSAFGGGDAVYKGGEIVDNAWTVTEYANGVRASLGLCLFHHKHYDLEIGVVGDDGIIESHFKRGEVTVSSRNNSEPVSYSLKPQVKLGHGGTEFPALRAFVDMIAGGVSPIMDAREAKGSVLVAAAAEKAIAEGKVVAISDL